MSRTISLIFGMQNRMELFSHIYLTINFFKSTFVAVIATFFPKFCLTHSVRVRTGLALDEIETVKLLLLFQYAKNSMLGEHTKLWISCKRLFWGDWEDGGYRQKGLWLWSPFWALLGGGGHNSTYCSITLNPSSELNPSFTLPLWLIYITAPLDTPPAQFADFIYT